MILLLSTLAAPALGQTAADFSHLGAVLRPDPAVPWLATALHHPTVDWDEARDRGVMVVATDLPADPDCPEGRTGLALARSSNSWHWNLAPGPLALPDPTASVGACRLTEPAVLYDEDADTLHIWYAAEDLGNVPQGIGHLELPLDAAGAPIWPPLDSGLVFPDPDLREPAALQYRGQVLMALVSYPNIHVASGATPTSLSLQGVGLDVDNYSVSWMEDAFRRGAVSCRATGSFPLEIWAGGVDRSAGTWGIGKGVASPLDITNFALASNALIALAGPAPRGYDVLRIDASDYVVYLGKFDRIEAVATVDPLTGPPVASALAKDCP